MKSQWLFGHTNQDECAVGLQKGEVLIPRQISTDSVNDKIELVELLNLFIGEFFAVPKFVGSERFSLLCFALPRKDISKFISCENPTLTVHTYCVGRDSNNMTSPCPGKLESQMTKSTNTHNANTMSWRYVVVVKRREHRSTSTHEWSGVFWFNAIRYLVAKPRIKHRVVGKTTQSFGESDALGTQNLVTRRALFTIQTGILQVAESDNRN